jgi:hypothetical protein
VSIERRHTPDPLGMYDSAREKADFGLCVMLPVIDENGDPQVLTCWRQVNTPMTLPDSAVHDDPVVRANFQIAFILATRAHWAGEVTYRW